MLNGLSFTTANDEEDDILVDPGATGSNGHTDRFDYDLISGTVAKTKRQLKNLVCLPVHLDTAGFESRLRSRLIGSRS